MGHDTKFKEGIAFKRLHQLAAAGMRPALGMQAGCYDAIHFEYPSDRSPVQKVTLFPDGTVMHFVYNKDIYAEDSKEFDDFIKLIPPPNLIDLTQEARYKAFVYISFIVAGIIFGKLTSYVFGEYSGLFLEFLKFLRS